jgi:hypothetical protein
VAKRKEGRPRKPKKLTEAMINKFIEDVWSAAPQPKIAQVVRGTKVHKFLLENGWTEGPWISQTPWIWMEKKP